MTDSNRKYDLIVAIVNADCIDEAMEAARSAGAAGGTIIRARSLSNAKAEQFIGITLAKEQEILLILTKRETKSEIMHALSERVGLKSEAGGVIFSLPVDKTAGIGVDTVEEQPEPKKTKESKEKAKPAEKTGEAVPAETAEPAAGETPETVAPEKEKSTEQENG